MNILPETSITANPTTVIPTLGGIFLRCKNKTPILFAYRLLALSSLAP